MSDLQLIKKRLIDENRIERLLEVMGCEYIKNEQRGSLITAQLPPHFYSDNKRACQIRLNDSLSCQIRNKGDFKGDIFNLISYIHNNKRGDELKKDLPKAKEFICKTFGWNEFLKGNHGDIIVKDYTACLKELLGEKSRNREIVPNPILPESVLEEFLPYPSHDWIREGISYKTQKIYGIGFDLESKRITIPMRNRFGQLVGVKGRIMKDEDDDRKYLYLYRYQNRLEWFNFHFAHPYILTDKKVYILEAEKSCMKLFEHGVYNTLAIGASDISEEQAQTIRQLGLDIEVILCYDKGISAEEIKKQAEIFKGRKVSAIFDIDNLLGNKQAPIDEGIHIWNKLVDEYIFEIKLK